MRVLIFEPNHTGHHFDYVRLLLPPVAELASSVVIATTRRAIDSEQYRVLLAPALAAALRAKSAGDQQATRGTAPIELETGIADRDPAKARGTMVAKALARADQFIACVKHVRPDHVIVPYADGLSQALVLRRLLLGGTVANDHASLLNPAAAPGSGDITSDALFMRSGIAYPTPTIKRKLAMQASWRLMSSAPHSHLFHQDPLMFAWISRHHPRLLAPGPGQRGWSLLPDPTPAFEPLTTAQARVRMGLSESGLIVGSVGMMDRRKGIDLLIRAFTRAKLPADAKLLLVGKQDAAVAAMLAPGGEAEALVKSGRIIAINRFVEVHELGWAMQAMDVVATAHSRHVGSASVAIKAAAVNRPILGSDFGWLGAMSKKFALGTTCCVEDIDSFARALEQSLNSAPGWKRSEGGRRFVAFHSEHNFGRAWGSLLRYRLGLPQPSDQIQWSWVEQAAEV